MKRCEEWKLVKAETELRIGMTIKSQGLTSVLTGQYKGPRDPCRECFPKLCDLVWRVAPWPVEFDVGRHDGVCLHQSISAGQLFRLITGVEDEKENPIADAANRDRDVVHPNARCVPVPLK